MGARSAIAWTDDTANFWAGCMKVSPGCANCYAEALVTTRMQLPVWGPPATTPRQRLKSAWVDVPRWNRAAARDGLRRKVFVSSLADVFEDHPDVTRWRAEALALLERCTSLDVQLLTKRPENVLTMVPPHWRESWPAHIWVGTTVEDQARAEQRVPHLLEIPAPVRFLSVEPLLERVDLTHVATQRHAGAPPAEIVINGLLGFCGATSSEDTPAARGIQWVIVGGESGPHARRFDLGWAREIVAQCREAGVAVFVKQLGARAVEEPDRPRDAPLPFRALRLRDRAGADPAEWPDDLRVQQFPGVSRG